MRFDPQGRGRGVGRGPEAQGWVDGCSNAAAGLARTALELHSKAQPPTCPRSSSTSRDLWDGSTRANTAMVEAAAAQGMLNRDAAIRESLLAIRRAGATCIITYRATEAAEAILQETEF